MALFWNYLYLSLGSSFGNVSWWTANWVSKLTFYCLFSTVSTKYHLDRKWHVIYECQTVGVFELSRRSRSDQVRKTSSITFHICSFFVQVTAFVPEIVLAKSKWFVRYDFTILTAFHGCDRNLLRVVLPVAVGLVMHVVMVGDIAGSQENMHACNRANISSGVNGRLRYTCK